MIRDAVKLARHADAPFRLEERCRRARHRRHRRLIGSPDAPWPNQRKPGGLKSMKVPVISLPPRTPAKSNCRRTCSAPRRAPTSWRASSPGSLPSAVRPHAVRARFGRQAHQQEAVPAEGRRHRPPGLRARPAVPRGRHGPWSPVVTRSRSEQEGPSSGPGLRASVKAPKASWSCWKTRRRRSQDQGVGHEVDGLGSTNGLVMDGADENTAFRNVANVRHIEKCCRPSARTSTTS